MILLRKRIFINSLYVLVVSLFFNELLITISSTRGLSYYIRSISEANWNDVYVLGFDNELARSAMWTCQSNDQLPGLAKKLAGLNNVKTTWNPVIYDMEIQGSHLNCCDYSNGIGEKIKFNITSGRQPNENDTNVIVLPEMYEATYELNKSYSFRINDVSRVETEYFNRYIDAKLCVIGFYSNAITFANSWSGDISGLTWYLETNSTNDAIAYNLDCELSDIRGDILPLIFVESDDIEQVISSEYLDDELVVFTQNVDYYIFSQKDKAGNTVKTILQRLIEYLFIGVLLTIADVLLYADSEASFVRIGYLLGRIKRESFLLAFLSRLFVILVGVTIGLIIYINNLSIGTTGGIAVSNNEDTISIVLSLIIMIVYLLFSFVICFLFGKDSKEYE